MSDTIWVRGCKSGKYFTVVAQPHSMNQLLAESHLADKEFGTEAAALFQFIRGTLRSGTYDRLLCALLMEEINEYRERRDADSAHKAAALKAVCDIFMERIGGYDESRKEPSTPAASGGEVHRGEE